MCMFGDHCSMHTKWDTQISNICICPEVIAERIYTIKQSKLDEKAFGKRKYYMSQFIPVRGILWFKIVCQNLLSDFILQKKQITRNTRFSQMKASPLSIPNITNKFWQRSALILYLLYLLKNKLEKWNRSRFFLLIVFLITYTLVLINFMRGIV